MNQSLLFPLVFWDGPPKHDITAVTAGLKYVVTGSKSGELCLWKIVHEKPPTRHHEEWIGKKYLQPVVAMVHEGCVEVTSLASLKRTWDELEMIVSGDVDGRLTLWDSSGGRCHFSRRVLRRAVTKILELPTAWKKETENQNKNKNKKGGERDLISCVSRGSNEIHIVDVHTLSTIAVLSQKGPVVDIAVSSSVRDTTSVIISIDRAGILSFWDLKEVVSKATTTHTDKPAAAASSISKSDTVGSSTNNFKLLSSKLMPGSTLDPKLEVPLEYLSIPKKEEEEEAASSADGLKNNKKNQQQQPGVPRELIVSKSGKYLGIRFEGGFFSLFDISKLLNYASGPMRKRHNHHRRHEHNQTKDYLKARNACVLLQNISLESNEERQIRESEGDNIGIRWQGAEFLHEPLPPPPAAAAAAGGQREDFKYSATSTVKKKASSSSSSSSTEAVDLPPSATSFSPSSSSSITSNSVGTVVLFYSSDGATRLMTISSSSKEEEEEQEEEEYYNDLSVSIEEGPSLLTVEDESSSSSSSSPSIITQDINHNLYHSAGKEPAAVVVGSTPPSGHNDDDKEQHKKYLDCSTTTTSMEGEEEEKTKGENEVDQVKRIRKITKLAKSFRNIRIRAVGVGLKEHLERTSTSDPYLQVYSGDELLWETEVVHNDPNPHWRDIILPTESIDPERPLRFIVLDHEDLVDDILGGVDVDIDLLSNINKNYTLPLRPVEEYNQQQQNSRTIRATASTTSTTGSIRFKAVEFEKKDKSSSSHYHHNYIEDEHDNNNKKNSSVDGDLKDGQESTKCSPSPVSVPVATASSSSSSSFAPTPSTSTTTTTDTTIQHSVHLHMSPDGTIIAAGGSGLAQIWLPCSPPPKSIQELSHQERQSLRNEAVKNRNVDRSKVIIQKGKEGGGGGGGGGQHQFWTYLHQKTREITKNKDNRVVAGIWKVFEQQRGLMSPIFRIDDAFDSQHGNPCTASVLAAGGGGSSTSSSSTRDIALLLARGYQKGGIVASSLLDGNDQVRFEYGHKGEVTCMVAVPPEQSPTKTPLLVSGGLDGCVCVWDLQKKDRLGRFRCRSPVLSLHWPQTAESTRRRRRRRKGRGGGGGGGVDNENEQVGDLVMAVTADNAIHIVSLSNLDTMQVLEGHDSRVVGIYRNRWAIQTDFIVTQTVSGTVYIWSLTTGHLDRLLSFKEAADFLVSRGLINSSTSAMRLEGYDEYDDDDNGKSFFQSLPMDTTDDNNSNDGKLYRHRRRSSSSSAAAAAGYNYDDVVRFTSSSNTHPIASSTMSYSPNKPNLRFSVISPSTFTGSGTRNSLGGGEGGGGPFAGSQSSPHISGLFTNNNTEEKGGGGGGGYGINRVGEMGNNQPSMKQTKSDNNDYDDKKNDTTIDGAITSTSPLSRTDADLRRRRGGEGEYYENVAGSDGNDGGISKSRSARMLHRQSFSLTPRNKIGGGGGDNNGGNSNNNNRRRYSSAAAISSGDDGASSSSSSNNNIRNKMVSSSAREPLMQVCDMGRAGSVLRANMFCINVNRLISELRTEYRHLSSRASVGSSGHGSGSGHVGAGAGGGGGDATQTLRAVLSYLFEWGVDKSIDKILKQQFGFRRPYPTPAFGVMSYRSKAVCLLFPGASVGNSRWELCPTLTAIHSLSLSALCMTMLSASHPSKQVYYTQVVSHYGVHLPDNLSTYVEPSVEVLVVYSYNQTEEVHMASRLLLQGVIERSSLSTLRKIVDRWTSPEYFEPILEKKFAVKHRLAIMTGTRAGSLSPFFETPVLSSDPSMDRKLIAALVLCLIAADQQRKRQKNKERGGGVQRQQASRSSTAAGGGGGGQKPSLKSDTKANTTNTTTTKRIPQQKKGGDTKKDSSSSSSNLVQHQDDDHDDRKSNSGEGGGGGAIRLTSAVVSQITETLLKVIFDAGSRQETSPHKALSPQDIVVSSLAAELMGKGFFLWRRHVTDVGSLISKLHRLSLIKRAALAGAAHRALLQAGQSAPRSFIRQMGNEALNLKTQARCRSGALFAIVALVKKYPSSLITALPSAVQIIIKCLDPSAPALRKSLLRPATAALHALVQNYPSVTFHQKSQRFAVGTTPRTSSVIVIYDLRTATKWRILSGHKKTITAVSFNPSATYLASYSPDEACLKFWETGSQGFLTNFLGIQGQCVKTVKLAPITIPPSGQTTSEALLNNRIVWISPKMIKLRREDGKVSEHHAS